MTNPHPFAYCPFCGALKCVVSWRFCSKWCQDYSTTKPKEQWAAPQFDNPDLEDPERNY